MSFYRGMLETILLVVIGLACSDVRGTNSALAYAKSTNGRELIRFYGPGRRLRGNLAIGLHSIDQAEWKGRTGEEKDFVAFQGRKGSTVRRLYQFESEPIVEDTPTYEPASTQGEKETPELPPKAVLRRHSKRMARIRALTEGDATVRPLTEEEEKKREGILSAEEQPEAYESESQSSDPTPEEEPKSESESSMARFMSDFEKVAEEDSHFPDWLVSIIVLMAALSSLCCCCTCFCLMRARSLAERCRRDNEEQRERLLDRLLDRDIIPKDFAPSAAIAKPAPPMMASTSGA